jgi:hypothetical protein
MSKPMHKPRRPEPIQKEAITPGQPVARDDTTEKPDVSGGTGSMLPSSSRRAKGEKSGGMGPKQ